MRTRLKELIYVALLTSLVCVSTMVIKIPSPLNGYVNLGDCMVLIAGWCLSPVYGFLSAGLGSALADLFSGYALYAPATFLIKGLMALVAFGTYKLLHKKIGKLPSQIIGGVLAEALMILGYFVFEGFLYGFGPSAVNILPNAIQGIAGVTIGIVLLKALEKLKLLKIK